LKKFFNNIKLIDEAIYVKKLYYLYASSRTTLEVLSPISFLANDGYVFNILDKEDS